METWMRQRPTKRRASLLNVKPFNWGEGTERTSTTIDKILYEEKP
jgi:hypothetical protein